MFLIAQIATTDTIVIDTMYAISIKTTSFRKWTQPSGSRRFQSCPFMSAYADIFYYTLFFANRQCFSQKYTTTRQSDLRERAKTSPLFVACGAVVTAVSRTTDTDSTTSRRETTYSP